MKAKVKRLLGDRIENAIGKIPGIKQLPCYENGKLKPDSGCFQMKTDLNNGLSMGQALKNRIVRRVTLTEH